MKVTDLKLFQQYFYNKRTSQATIELVEIKEQEVFTNYIDDIDEPVTLLYTFEIVKQHKKHLNRRMRGTIRLLESDIEEFVYPITELVKNINNFDI